MKWRIVFARSAEKELAKISSDTQLRIGRAIRALEDDPIPSSSKRLKGREEFFHPFPTIISKSFLICAE